MKLSIIVPVYNMSAEGRLQFCMDSLVNQTISDYEIIAVNDASTDDSLAILREYECRYPDKMKVLTYSENKKQGGAKNVGLEYATGDWIGFVDSDDWVTPDFYEKLIDRAEKSGADFVGCDYSLVNTHTFQVGDVHHINTSEQVGVLNEELHKKHLISPGSMVVKIYRHSVIRENHLRFPENIFYEDNCAGPLWSLYFSHFERVDEPLYYYYQHNSSTVHHISEEKCIHRMKAMDQFYERCLEEDFLLKYREEVEYCYVRLFYINTLFTYMQGIKKPSIGFIKELRKKTEGKFPQFHSNYYYSTLVPQDERRLIMMQCKSDEFFFVYYRVQLIIRRLRKNLNSKIGICKVKFNKNRNEYKI